MFGISSRDWQSFYHFTVGGPVVDRFRQVILMLDGDVTGRKASKVIAEKLRPLSTVQVLSLPVGAQPDQLSSEAIREMLQKA